MNDRIKPSLHFARPGSDVAVCGVPVAGVPRVTTSYVDWNKRDGQCWACGIVLVRGVRENGL